MCVYTYINTYICIFVCVYIYSHTCFCRTDKKKIHISERRSPPPTVRVSCALRCTCVNLTYASPAQIRSLETRVNSWRSLNTPTEQIILIEQFIGAHLVLNGWKFIDLKELNEISPFGVASLWRVLSVPLQVPLISLWIRMSLNHIT